MRRETHIGTNDGLDLIFSASLSYGSNGVDTVNNVTPVLTNGSYNQALDAFYASAMRDQRASLKYDMLNTYFWQKIQAAKTVVVKFDIYPTTNNNYGTPLAIGEYISSSYNGFFMRSEGFQADPRSANTATSTVACPINQWTTIQYTLQNITTNSADAISTNTYNNITSSPSAFTIQRNQGCMRYISVLGKIWSGGGTITAYIRNIRIWSD